MLLDALVHTRHRKVGDKSSNSYSVKKDSDCPEQTAHFLFACKAAEMI